MVRYHDRGHENRDKPNVAIKHHFTSPKSPYLCCFGVDLREDRFATFFRPGSGTLDSAQAIDATKGTQPLNVR
jgi:hypothetical protein